MRMRLGPDRHRRVLASAARGILPSAGGRGAAVRHTPVVHVPGPAPWTMRSAVAWRHLDVGSTARCAAIRQLARALATGPEGVAPGMTVQRRRSSADGLYGACRPASMANGGRSSVAMATLVERIPRLDCGAGLRAKRLRTGCRLLGTLRWGAHSTGRSCHGPDPGLKSEIIVARHICVLGSGDSWRRSQPDETSGVRACRGHAGPQLSAAPAWRPVSCSCASTSEGTNLLP